MFVGFIFQYSSTASEQVLLMGSKTWTFLGKPTIPKATVKCTVEQQTLTRETLVYKSARDPQRLLSALGPTQSGVPHGESSRAGGEDRTEMNQPYSVITE